MRPAFRASVLDGVKALVLVRGSGYTGKLEDRNMTMRARASWDEYFMAIARVVATRSTCDRKHVGAVIVRDKMILATGYNGSIRGLDHCDDEGHLMEDGHCVRTVHAEANAIVQAARNGVRIEGADIYVTASPCLGCFKLIANAGLDAHRVRRVLSRFAHLRAERKARHQARPLADRGRAARGRERAARAKPTERSAIRAARRAP